MRGGFAGRECSLLTEQFCSRDIAAIAIRAIADWGESSIPNPKGQKRDLFDPGDPERMICPETSLGVSAFASLISLCLRVFHCFRDLP
jgi:hypothetical protein